MNQQPNFIVFSNCLGKADYICTIYSENIDNRFIFPLWDLLVQESEHNYVVFTSYIIYK